VPTLTEATRYGTFDEFAQVYQAGQATTWVDDTGRTLLTLAVANTDPGARTAIANRLLDDGADAAAVIDQDQYNVLHILFGHVKHDVEPEARLLERLLERGADVNWVSPRWGTPIQTLASTLKFSDETFAPFYDVLFARPDLDLLRPGASGRSSWTSARRSRKRQQLAARMEEYLRRHGQWTDDLEES
jgi:hypothetical protein